MYRFTQTHQEVQQVLRVALVIPEFNVKVVKKVNGGISGGGERKVVFQNPKESWRNEESRKKQK